MVGFVGMRVAINDYLTFVPVAIPTSIGVSSVDDVSVDLPIRSTSAVATIVAIRTKVEPEIDSVTNLPSDVSPNGTDEA